MSERSIFLAALDIADPAQQLAYLNQVCGDDHKLRAHIEELIAAEAKLGGFLAEPHSAAEVTAEFVSAIERPGTVIGPYKLLQQIGEGGFGIVYMAEQQRPVRRKVALKIIKPGMDTREVIARFEAERQALALMDHPNIARVLDGGTTESGRPYFVMELVKGVPLTQFCDDNKLDMRQRLTLFSAVCKAIQHAHHKGVIHRDIKPSNVMVTLHDGQPVPKVIDFGVSKAISQQLTEKTMFTAYGQMIGTPAYMSPEQAEMSGLDIDTRSDVYSLGVLLYELLTGTTPLEAKSLRGKAYAELQRMIREDEPPRPSLRVSTQGNASALIASQRGTVPRELGAMLRGELDWIVMKALEKNRDRRYESANTFAADVERYLRHEAVEACPPSAVYRVRKFIRRNRVACTTGTLIAFSLLGGILFSGLAARDALYQRRLAEESLQVAKVRESEAKTARLEESAQRSAAEQERDKAKALNIELAKQKEQQRRSLYVAQMNLIRKAWDSNNTQGVRELLNAARPLPGEADFRGFEWHYWMRMLHGEERVLQLPIGVKAERASLGSARLGSDGQTRKEGVLAAAFSPDGKYVATVTESSSWLVKVWETSSGKEFFANEISKTVASNISIAHVDSQKIALVLTTSTPNFSRSNPFLQIPGTARLRVFGTDTGEEKYFREAEFVRGQDSPFAFSHDGSCFAVPLKESFVQVCSIQSGAEITRVAIPTRESASRVSEILALSPDGRKLAIKPSVRNFEGTAPFGITIYNLGTDEQVETPSVRAQQLEFSADGLHVSTFDRMPSAPEGRVKVFNATTGSEAGQFAMPLAVDEIGKSSDPWTQCFSPIGSWLAFTCKLPLGNATLQLWNLSTGETVPPFQGYSASPVAMRFSEDGRRLLSIHEDGKLMIWPVPTPLSSPPTITSTPPSSERPDFLRFLKGRLTSSPDGRSTSPDGRWLIYGHGPNPIATDVEESPAAMPAGELILKDQSGKVADRNLKLTGRLFDVSRFSPNNRYVAAIGVSQEGELDTATELKVWDVLTGRELVAIQAPARELPSARSSRIVLNEQPILPDVPMRIPYLNFRAIAFSPDSQRLALPLLKVVVEGAPRQEQEFIINVWELPTGRLLHPIAGQPMLTSSNIMPKFSSGGDLLLGFPLDNELPGRSPIENSQFRAQVLKQLSTALREPGIRVWESATGRLLWEDRGVSMIVTNADDTRLAGIVKSNVSAVDPSFAAVVWDAPTGREIWRIPLSPNSPLTGFVLSADGSRVAMASGSEVVVYDVDHGKKLFLLQGHAGEIRSVAFSPGNSRIASAAGTMRSLQNASANLQEQLETKIWDGVTGQELLSPPGVTGQVVPTERFFSGDGGLQFSPRLLVAPEGTTWDASPLPPSTEAEELVQWLGMLNEDGLLPTLDEIRERLMPDPSITDDVKSLAISLARQQRTSTVLQEHALDLLRNTDLPRAGYDRALAWIKEADEQSPNDHGHFHVRALAHYRMGDFAAAEDTATRAIEMAVEQQRSTVAEDLTVLAMTQYQLGQSSAALQALDQARALASLDELYWRQLLQEAETKLEIPPADATPDRWIGRRCMPRLQARVTDETGRPTTSFDIPFSISRVEGNRLWFGKLSIERSDVIPLEDAVAYFTSVLQVEPASETAQRKRGVAWRYLGEPEKAIEDYSTAIRLNPANAPSGSFVSRGNVYGYELDDFAKALEDFDEAIRLRPNYAVAHKKRGEMLWRLGRWDAAMKSLDEAIRLDVNSEEAYGVRAQIWSAKGDREKMRQDLDEGVLRSPDDPFSWSHRAWLLATSPNADHRDGKQAVAAATKACKLSFWKEAQFLDILAAAHAEAGDFAEAVKWAEQAVSLAPKHKRAKYESRLQMYKAGKPYRDQPTANVTTE
jgi:serine/threonine protein kinase/WD40 repeat protein/tetratricopeptide (TPR) repeat protein